MKSWAHSFMGPRSTDPASEILGTDYDRFESTLGIDGLAKETGDKLEILAVIANQKGTGQFRRFIRECRASYREVCIWEVWNTDLRAALLRYGFLPTHEFTDEGEMLIGWKWSVPASGNRFKD